MSRDHITQKEALALMQIQMPEEEKIKRSDFVINNDGTVAATQDLIDRFYEEFMNKIKK
jgi:dephospho-CoA kinase